MSFEDNELLKQLKRVVRDELNFRGVNLRTRRIAGQEAAARISAARAFLGSGNSNLTRENPANTTEKFFTIGFDGFESDESWVLG